MSALLQWLIVGLIVGWSLQVALRRLLPGVSRQLQSRLARLLAMTGAARLAARLQVVAPAAAACDSGCSGCDTGCSKVAVPVTPVAQPVQWRSPPSSGACH